MKFNRYSLIYGLYLIVLVAIAQYVGDLFEIPLWPAYMCMILFFVEHEDMKKAPHIVVGGVVGIAGILLFVPVIGFLAPFVGFEASKIALIVALVYVIVAFHAPLPIAFNNYTFMFLTVSGLALQTPGANPYVWMTVTVLGGAFLMAGAMAIGKVMGAPPTPSLAN